MQIEDMITLGNLPGAFFADEAALTEFRQERETYEQAVTRYELDGDAGALSHALGAMCFEASEIAAHDQLGYRTQTAFAIADCA